MNRALPITFVAASLLACNAALAGTILVPADQPSIKAAIAAATSGDEIVVADGVYVGPDNRGMSFGGKNLVLRSANGPSTCFIDLQGVDRAFDFTTGETTASVVDGFTISGGTAVGTWNRGGAIICHGTTVGAGPTIRNCVFQNNTAGLGGAIGVFQTSAPVIENCAFEANTATGSPGGGALYTEGPLAAPTLRDCKFTANVSVDCGGAMIATTGSTAVVERCDFIGNTCPNLGGGIYNPTLSLGKFWNCRFLGNHAGVGGGGMNVSFSSAATLVNCIFSGNTANSLGGGATYVSSAPAARIINCTMVGNSTSGSFGGDEMLVVGSNGTVISNCIIVGDPDSILAIAGGGSGPVVSRSIVSGGFPGEGNLDVDPMLADPDGPDDVLGTADDDLRLLPDSPAIDSGSNPLYTVALPTDLDGNARMVDDPAVRDSGLGEAPIVDRGAYEAQGCEPADVDCDGDVDGADLGILLAAWGGGGPVADLDGDGIVNGGDLGMMLAAWTG